MHLVLGHGLRLWLSSSTVGRRGTGSGRCAVGIGVCRCRLVGQPGKLVTPRSLKTRRLRSSYSLAATSLSGSALGFFGGRRTTTIAGFLY